MHKVNVTIEEGVSYIDIDSNKLSAVSNKAFCLFVVWLGKMRLLKRKKFKGVI